MKTTILKISAFVLLLVFVGVGCEKEKNISKKGKVIFYTNAQAMLNCGPFDVTVYIDNRVASTISSPYTDNVLPDPTESTSTLILEEDTGKHRYTAKMDCAQYGTWTGDFEIHDNSIKYVFLDIKDCILNN